MSSFDKTKKFAILHQLFHGDKGMGEFTTLLLTHDIEPAIDIFLNPTSRKFTAVRPSVHFLQGRAGVVVEKRIERSHISTFVKVCDVNIQTSADDVIKCIYLRRKLEVLGNRGGDAYHVLSSLVHLREAPDCGVDNNIRIPMPEARLAAAVSKIQESIPDFDYDTLLNQLKDADCLKRKFDDTSVVMRKFSSSEL